MEKFDLIDKYFTNSLSDNEQAEFNDFLQNDKAFKEEFLFQRDLKKVLLNDQRDSLKTTLQGFEKNRNKRKVISMKKWFIAASTIIFLGISYFITQNYINKSPERLYTSYFEPYRNVIQPVVRGENEKTIESGAFTAYENGKYYKAINLFNSVPNKNDEYIRFYRAMCYLELKNNQSAINLLLPIATNKSKNTSKCDFKQPANWYLGLAYLRSGEKDKAISQFNITANNPDFEFKKEESKLILEKLQ